MRCCAASIRCDDPVIYLEHKELWGERGDVDPGADAELGRAIVRRPGRDLTLVTWSKAVHWALAAAEAAAAGGRDVEVIDLRTLWPWDRETVLGSAARTGRLLVVHEAVEVAGFGAEIAATAAEALGVRVARLGAPRIPVGYAAALEAVARLSPESILKRIESMLA